MTATQARAVKWRETSAWNGRLHYARSCGFTLNVTLFKGGQIEADVNHVVAGHRESVAARRWEEYADRPVTLGHAKEWCEAAARRHADR